MKQRIVLAYSGGVASSVAIPWLANRFDADIITVTVDTGHGDELDEVRARALALGAIRAHVLDVREEFARDHLLPALRSGAVSADDCRTTAAIGAPLIAKKLAEIAAIENTPTVAFGRDTRMTREEQYAYARAHNIPLPAAPAGRRTRTAARGEEAAAYVEIGFVKGAAVSINRIPMRLTELLESLTTIAGEHGIAVGGDTFAPAALVLHTAYSAGEASRLTGSVRLKLFNTTCEVVGRTAAPDAGSLGEGVTLAQV